MSVKHLYQSTEGLVLKSLQGAVSLNPALSLDVVSKSVYLRSHSPHKRVAVIAGGGSGHEPAHAGYTGTGMLAACVAGDVFASPSAKQILSTIKFAAFSGIGAGSSPRDVLVIINNYTGDRLNFGLAMEKARSAFPKLNIQSVVVADDISLLGNDSTALVGPRGLAGNILVCKLLGALAETGASLETVKAFGESVVQNLKSIGMGLDPCHIPGRAVDDSSRLEFDEYELGLGLHNEAGVAKHKIESADTLLQNMISALQKTVGQWKNDESVLFINNLGGISQLEMGAIVHDVLSSLDSSGFTRPRRIYCSSYMTSLNAPGFSISLLNASLIHARSPHHINIYALLDAETTASAWIGSRKWDHSDLHDENEGEKNIIVDPTHPEIFSGSQLPSFTGDIIRAACIRVLEVEAEITKFDTIVGDGDCGETFAAGANAIVKALDSGTLDIAHKSLASVIRSIADIIEDVMGGTMGALLGIFFNAFSSALSEENAPVEDPSSFRTISYAVQKAVAAVELYTPARVGDRTIMDALQPFCSALRSSEEDDVRQVLSGAVRAARRGTDATRGMVARLGRAVYLSVPQDNLPPDPGAWGVCALLEGVLEGLPKEAGIA